MKSFVPTIGLEIHAELSTLSKMFCSCRNDPHASKPNVNVCPVCLGHPGTLPVINRDAFKKVLQVGMATGGVPANFTEFDRKNYFYPDIPKGYQISQYKYPLISGGAIGPVRITRIHLEEDTARSTHTPDGSLVDFNRAGVPLMELVTEPVIHDPKTAISFARDFRLCLRYMGVSGANLEKGEMRIEANISIAEEGASQLGTKVEVKNLNSFKAVEGAIEYEIRRQRELLLAGAIVIQETRGWDESKQRTFSQRAKEDAHDYRYYPDPDLPKCFVSFISDMRSSDMLQSLPIMPWELRTVYVSEGMQPHVIELLLGNDYIRNFYNKVIEFTGTDITAKNLSLNYITSDLWGLLQNQESPDEFLNSLNPLQFSEIINMLSREEISSRGAKLVINEWVISTEDPRKIAKRLDILQISDKGELKKIIRTILENHAEIVKEYHAGKKQSFEFLIGQVMKATHGSANPTVVREVLQPLLSEDIRMKSTVTKQ